MKLSLFVVCIVSFCVISFGCEQADPAQGFGHWMRQAGAKLENQQLNEILIPGSHDAAISEVKNLVASGMSSQYVTQKRDIGGQLCAGSRWFDLRFYYYGTSGFGTHKGWYAVHPLAGPSPLVKILNGLLGGKAMKMADVFNQIQCFLRDHTDEFLFARIKLVDSSSSGVTSFLTELNRLIDHNLIFQPTSKLQTTKASKLKGKVVLLNYDWTVPAGTWGPLFTDYKSFQEGGFSNTKVATEIIRKQVSNFEAYDVAGQNKLFGMWWTTTTGDVWNLFASVKQTERVYFNDYVKTRTTAERGAGRRVNVIVTDFLGEWSAPMAMIAENYPGVIHTPPVLIEKKCASLDESENADVNLTGIPTSVLQDLGDGESVTPSKFVELRKMLKRKNNLSPV